MIKHITLGTDEVFHYNYFGEMLPLRPISSYELDDCFYRALIGATEQIAELVVKLKLGQIKKDQEIPIDNKKLAELKRYFDALDYWIVYYGMKDFQEETFSILDVKKMRSVHAISMEILTYSYQPKEVIQEIVRDEAGKNIATIIFTLNVPLGKLSELTKLQRDFLILAKIEKQTPHKDISKTGDTVNLRDLLGGLV